nr:hypothetical protein BaRGS_021346 [Batillaria attramentaria]
MFHECADGAQSRQPTGNRSKAASQQNGGQIVVGEQEGEFDENAEYDDENDGYDDENGDYVEGGEEEGKEEEEYEEEEVEEEFDYKTFQYRPYQYYERDPDEPRVTIDTGPEGFDDSWDPRHESTLKPRLADRLMANKGYVWGYPNFVFVETKQNVAHDEEEYDEGEGGYDDGGGEGQEYDEELGEHAGEEEEEYYEEEEEGAGEYDPNTEHDQQEEGAGEYDPNTEHDQQEEGAGEYDPNTEHDQQEEGAGEYDPNTEHDQQEEGYYDEDGEFHEYRLDSQGRPVMDSQGRPLTRPRTEEVKEPTPRPSSAIVDLLPRIGYTPEPTHVSEGGNRVGTAAKAHTPVSLPPIPTPASSEMGSRARTREPTPVKFVPRQLNRTFQGKYYDPVTKQSYEFEITPDFRRRIDRWHVRKEGLDHQPTSPSTQPFHNDMASRQSGEASQSASRQSGELIERRRVVTRW